MMHRIARATALAAALCFGAVDAPRAQQLTAESAQIVDLVSAYLNQITTLTGDFVQIAPDGVISEGRFAMRRPGRIMFRYLPPSTTKIISDGFWVAVVDEDENAPPDRYPLSETPLNLILQENVDLRREDSVRLVEHRDGKYRVTAIDPTGEAQGSITMIFETQPLTLEQWVVVDDQGLETSVILRNAQAGAEVDPNLFSIPKREFDDDR